MCKTISIANQKGGVGKSTTAGALAAGLSLKGYKVLTVDLDAQANATYAAAASVDGYSVYDLLTGRAAAEDCIQHTPAGDVIAASFDLSSADTVITQTGREYRLRDALDPLRARYDFIIIDTPPALGVLTVNALTASDSVIIPIHADIFSLQGVERLARTMEPVKKYCNPKLRVEGLLLTEYSPRSILSREVADRAAELAETLGGKLFRTTIRANVAAREAQTARQNIFEYSPRSNAAKDYSRFIAELLEG